MSLPQIVIDTNVIIAGLRSRRGSAFQLLSLIGTGKFDMHLSVPLVLEYTDVLLRELPNLYLSREEVDDLIDFYCSVGIPHKIFFLWRPFLRDPKDDMVLELAVKAGCQSIITYNTRDFAGVEQFGLSLLEPSGFLRLIGKLP
ncbi:MAG: putative toxin-antitoxin system toxin component, PIN family [Microcystis sp. M015S2]|jgi:putative PIN family toxin of toxin-antitoxin system|uniref:putative toxin-antitoxin system toxin component, PIN family n=1 Tax=Microcystis TaxID=1125 RepID=UPI00232EEF21|nr:MULTISPECIES: putative toxin-antitoxin system toxin component, PIN family [Microcystis]MCA2653444.1 putative toxin-antitoxin system toxin component, PIN family [Microcystis sp. M061S2]MCA2709630.1 putative toxin-antitoxin system toxin component, PIN family [Microcystis sp. M025S2]MCA2742601.1 putative toxin-antitoxin system toxin component, PIN family [Microcystis sp. M015S2]MCA2757498.1 putative toxin-antitoxin system toxin component, PIN family [Microcystis sp. M145S2]MDB9413137.1 putativ